MVLSFPMFGAWHGESIGRLMHGVADVKRAGAGREDMTALACPFEAMRVAVPL
jgi:hypothetical protein